MIRNCPARGVVIIFALLCFASLPGLLTRDLWGPDETRYIEVAREMVVLELYLLPRLNSELYSEKPPLFFWVVSALWKAGLGHNSARILSVLSSGLIVLSVYLVSLRLYDSHTALLSACAVLTAFLFLPYTNIGVLDPFLTLLTTLSIFFGFFALRPEARFQRALWCCCYALMGLSILTKGPVGLLIPGFTLLTYGLLNRNEIKAGGLVHLLGGFILTGVVCAWLVPALIAGGEGYSKTILIRQNLGRLFSSFSHKKPAYYYALWAPACFFP